MEDLRKTRGVVYRALRRVAERHREDVTEKLGYYLSVWAAAKSGEGGLEPEILRVLEAYRTLREALDDLLDKAP